ncbi:hypothetical protein KKD52_04265 [Myxococcota bacterium]|nr:hypothetical protein [Myxococcota bacterium]MBU1410695.1 hypothetical protein [Myxococcota bacterium]MBU1509557.1 hypothetical protein [Myxococcota bacterium]
MSTIELTPQVERLIEEYALRMESFGMPPLAGRIFAVMVLTDPPEKSTQDLIQLTGGSKGALSQTLRILEQFGHLEKCPAPGQRGHRWRLRKNFMVEMFKSKMNAIRGMRDFWQSHMDIVGNLSDNVQQNVREMAEFHAFFFEMVSHAFERWSQVQIESENNKTDEGKGTSR